MATTWTPIGEFRQKAVIQQKSTSKGSGGEQVESWSTYATVWCKIVPGRGREAEKSRRETGVVPTRFILPYRSGITLAMRFSYGGRLFNIIGVADIEELKRELWIETVEKI